MAGVSQITPVDDIAQDDQKLEEKATQLSGVDLVIDQEKIGTDFEMVDSSVRAILVKKHSADGAVRVFGKSIRNVVTGPKEGTGFVIVIVESVEECMLLGSPSVRYFRRRTS